MFNLRGANKSRAHREDISMNRLTGFAFKSALQAGECSRLDGRNAVITY